MELVLGVGVGVLLGDEPGDPEDDPEPVVGVADGLDLGLPELWPVVGLLPCALEVPPAEGPPELVWVPAAE